MLDHIVAQNHIAAHTAVLCPCSISELTTAVNKALGLLVITNQRSFGRGSCKPWNGRIRSLSVYCALRQPLLLAFAPVLIGLHVIPSNNSEQSPVAENARMDHAFVGSLHCT